MPLSVFIEMTLYAILNVWSSGPNNILSFSIASKYGVSGNLCFMSGIWSGSLTLMCLSGLFCSTLGKIIPGKMCIRDSTDGALRSHFRNVHFPL